MTNENDAQRSWWKTLPGVLTSAAALVTAVTGLIVAIGSSSATNGKQDPCLKLPLDDRPAYCLEENR